MSRRNLFVALLSTLLAVVLSTLAVVATEDWIEAVDSALLVNLTFLVPLLSLTLWPEKDGLGATIVSRTALARRYGANSKGLFVRVGVARALALSTLLFVAALATLVAVLEDETTLLGEELRSTLPVYAALGPSLAAYNLCASEWFGRRGLLVATLFGLFLGLGDSVFGLLSPLGFARRLLALGEESGLSPSAAFFALGAQTFVFGLLALLRAPR